MQSSRNTKPRRNLRVQFRFRHNTRAALVAAGFQDAEPAGAQAQILFLQCVEQMHEIKGGAKKGDGLFRIDRITEKGNRFIDINAPSAVRLRLAGE